MSNPYSVAAQRIWERANNPATPAHERKRMIKEGNEQAVNDVFGVGHRTDVRGNPIEMGMGSPLNQTRPSIEAYKRYHRDDPDYEDVLKRLELELVESEKRRRREED